MNTLLVGVFVALALYTWSRSGKPSKGPVPPGPKPLPLIGNILDLTPKELWLRVTGWARQYGLLSPFLFCGVLQMARLMLPYRARRRHHVHTRLRTRTRFLQHLRGRHGLT